MLPSQILERGWCQRFSAVDENGYEVQPEDCVAVKHCISGALKASRFFHRITKDQSYKIVNKLDDIVEQYGYATYVDYNDSETTTKNNVVKIVQYAEQSIGLVIK